MTLAARSDRRAGGFVNAVLRRVAAEGRAKLVSSARATTPAPGPCGCPIRRGWSGSCATSSATPPREALLEAGNAAPERCLRANPSARRAQAAATALLAEGSRHAGSRRPSRRAALRGAAAGALLARSATASSRRSPADRRSPASWRPGGVTGPGAAFLDLCAAPGAKTSQLAALLPGAAITAVEVDEARADDPAREPRASRRRRRRRRPRRRPRAAPGLGRLLRRRAARRAVQRTGHARFARRPALATARRDVPRLAELQARLLARAAALSSPAARSPTRSARSRARRRSASWSRCSPPAAGRRTTWAPPGQGLGTRQSGGFLLVLPPDRGSSGLLRRAAAPPHLSRRRYAPPAAR